MLEKQKYKKKMLEKQKYLEKTKLSVGEIEIFLKIEMLEKQKYLKNI